MKLIKQNKLIILVFLGAIITISVLTFSSSDSPKVVSLKIVPTPTPYCTMKDTNASNNPKSTYKKYAECKPVGIFFSDKATNEEISSFRDKLSKTKGVYYLKYVSREDSLKTYEEQNKDNPLLLKQVSRDMLPASFEVYVSDPTLKASLISDLKKNKIVSEVI